VDGDVDEAYKIIKICSDRFDQIENKPERYFFINILMLKKKIFCKVLLFLFIRFLYILIINKQPKPNL
jgi:hypothetical protein